MPLSIHGTNGITFNDGSTQNTRPAVGFKNRIINGDMRIDQRNAGASVTINTAANIYGVDRWYGLGQASDGVFTIQQNTSAPTGFNNSTKITVTTADSSISATQVYRFTQAIEGLNCADLALGSASAQTMTLSFWVRSSLTGTFGGSLANSNFTRAYAFSYTISSANTWEQKSITIAGDTTGTWLTTNGAGIHVSFSIGMGSSYTGTANVWNAGTTFAPTGGTNIISTVNADIYFTGVQLEAGSTATEFERRPYGTELQLAMRYFRKTDVGTYGEATIFGYALSGDSAGQSVPYPVPMRAAPTATYGGTWSRLNTTANIVPYATSYLPFLTASSNGVTYQYSNNSGFVTFNAEL